MRRQLNMLVKFVVAALQTSFAEIANQGVGQMEAEKVVPDVIDSVPPSILDVKYGDIIVNLGNELTPTQVTNAPEIKWTGDPDKFYVLSMVDPDAPSRKLSFLREVSHWLVVNIPGSDISKGETISEYTKSGPPNHTGLHRYIFLVYEQPQKLTFDEKRGTNAKRFSIRNFAKKYNLGQPIAGNFFQAKYDESVPTIFQFLTGRY